MRRIDKNLIWILKYYYNNCLGLKRKVVCRNAIFAKILKMADPRVRVRFAPSPTGPLHIGGVRTALYNYLFARQHNGDFLLRIEDTDQGRFVPGAEAYIIESLKWAGIMPNEGVGIKHKKGQPRSYKQSKRNVYKKYAEELVKKDKAYYAFDTPEDLENIRKELEASKAQNTSYSYHVRNKMKNSLTLKKEEVIDKIKAGVPYVVRIKMPENTIIQM